LAFGKSVRTSGHCKAFRGVLPVTTAIAVRPGKSVSVEPNYP
jgi:hypothetical protein